MPDTLLGTVTPQSTPIRVLVVDDDATMRELLAALLEGEGYAVESAESGESALALFHGSAYAADLVLADVQMPGITGAQLARKLRQTCGSATLLLAMSGSQPPAQTVSLFDGFLLKPFKIEQISAALRERSHPSKESDHLFAADIPRSRRKRGVSSLDRTSKPTSKSISTSAPARKPASKSNMSVQIHEPLPAEGINAEKISIVPVLNETIYRQLANSIPTPQLQEMYALCVNDARKRIAGMRILVATHDSAQFVREAHSIKGGCGMLGATELHRMAAALEANGLDTGRGEAARNVNSLDELSAACDRLERMLKSRV